MEKDNEPEKHKWKYEGKDTEPKTSTVYYIYRCETCPAVVHAYPTTMGREAYMVNTMRR